ncbi:hypothetical protein FCH28_04710 [Streptomyces piniterrae]|uniref:DUF4352 domain-containing protein n=1 Tax=Streptomyces piniterrae TaxID=2571125 RepID=A0A4U0NQT3_9ACTN|nr:hypothetical protein [Streptomyces piniterrae]TJZ56827.1 hypothetical protein FCH28_04710 [Streptomyces piniterrae]
MSTRLLATLAVGSIVLIAGCSAGGNDAKDDAPTNADSSPSVSKPKYTKFADFPGKDFVTTEPGLKLGVRVKPVDTRWAPELVGKPADAGKHYFAVYVAVTGELADRGVENVKLSYLRLKFKSSTGEKCGFGQSENCYYEAFPSSQLEELEKVSDGEWRNATWTESILGTNIERGETKIGVVGFSLPDTEKATSFELCGPTKEAMVDTDRFACVPVKTPDKNAG